MDRVFSKSARAQELNQVDETVDERADEVNASTESFGTVRQRSIITLSSQSSPPSPSPPTENKLLNPHQNVHLTNSFVEMEDITTNMRNIAALAARRRSRAFLNATEAGHQRSNSDDNKLTVSRLAYHDNKYALGQQSRTAIDDSASNFTDQEGFSTQRSNQNRHKYHKKTTKKLPPMQFGAMNTRFC